MAINDRGAIDSGQIAEMLREETLPVGQRFRVTGDPFLAANRIASRLVRGIAYTRDESMAFTYFYVNEAVEFPRYLCRDCADKGVDPYAVQHDWVATTAFDREDRLSYPLKAAFVKPEAQVSTSPADDSEAPVVINNYYANKYPYYPGYYYPRWGSSFYFSIGWNWGSWGGWGWVFAAMAAARLISVAAVSRVRA